MGRTRLAMLVLVTACGRVDFETRNLSDASIDVACGAVENQTLACQIWEQGTITQVQTYDCAAGAWGAWGTTSDTCVCVGASVVTHPACPAGYAGIETQVMTYTCPTGTAMTTTDMTDCTALYTWQVGGAQTGPFATQLPNEAGTECPTQGQTAACSMPSGGGMYFYYDTCTCE